MVREKRLARCSIATVLGAYTMLTQINVMALF